MKRTDGGFTLIELMIVVLILAILLNIAIPAFVSVIQNYRIVGQANDLTASLALARSEAIKRGGPVIVCRSPNAISGAFACVSGAGSGGWEVGWMVFVDSNRDGLFTAGEQVLLVRGPLSGNNTMTGNGTNNNMVTYTSQGVTSSFGAFALLDPRGGVDGTRYICLANTGRTRVVDGSYSGCPAGG